MWFWVSQGLYANHRVGVLCSLSPESFRLVTQSERAKAPWLTWPRIPSYGNQSVGGEQTEMVCSHIAHLGREEMVLDTRVGKHWISHSLAKAQGATGWEVPLRTQVLINIVLFWHPRQKQDKENRAALLHQVPRWVNLFAYTSHMLFVAMIKHSKYNLSLKYLPYLLYLLCPVHKLLLNL